MTNTLVKLQRHEAPPPQPPAAPPITRTYLQEQVYPRTQLIQVATAAEADVVERFDDYVAFYTTGNPTPQYKRVVRVTYWKRVSAGSLVVLVPVTVTVPAPQQASAAVTQVAPAWDATAWSIEALTGAVQAQFAVGSGVTQGAIAGLAVAEPTADTLQTYIVHGFKIDLGQAYVVVNPPAGAQVLGDVQYLALATPVQQGTVCRITRIGPEVRYYVNELLVAVAPSYLNDKPVRLAGVLYAVGDEIDAPALESLNLPAVGEALLGPVLAVGSDYDYAFGSAEIVLFALGTEHVNGAVVPALWAEGTDTYLSAGQALLPQLQATGFGYEGTVGQGTALIAQIVAMGADHDYAFGSAELLLFAEGHAGDYGTELISYAKASDQWAEGLATFEHRGLHATAGAKGHFQASVSPAVRLDAKARAAASFKGSMSWIMEFASRAQAQMMWAADRVMDVALVARGDVTAGLAGVLVLTGRLDATAAVGVVMDTARTLDAELRARATAGVGYVPQQVLHAALDAMAYAGVAMGEPGKNLSVWSVNPTNNASAAYEDFPFNSFATIGGRHYGASDTGIYELTGEDDAGAPIRASIHLGKRDFGSPALKGISYCYLGVSSTGRMVVRVTTPTGESYLYQTRSNDAFQATQRADFGRGLRAHYLELEIYNEDGADFELERLEFVVNEMKRRI